MRYFAYSTKERYNELQKNPLVFCKYGSVNVHDEIGYNHATEAWTSCDQTVRFMAYEKDLPKNELTVYSTEIPTIDGNTLFATAIAVLE